MTAVTVEMEDCFGYVGSSKGKKCIKQKFQHKKTGPLSFYNGSEP